MIQYQSRKLWKGEPSVCLLGSKPIRYLHWLLLDINEFEIYYALNCGWGPTWSSDMR